MLILKVSFVESMENFSTELFTVMGPIAFIKSSGSILNTISEMSTRDSRKQRTFFFPLRVPHKILTQNQVGVQIL